jgi:hypothetical protein
MKKRIKCTTTSLPTKFLQNRKMEREDDDKTMSFIRSMRLDCAIIIGLRNGVHLG